MNALRILFPNGPLPYSAEGGFNLFLSRQNGQILGVLYILMRFRKQEREFLVGRLEDAESTIQRTVYDLNVLHSAYLLRNREAFDAKVKFEISQLCYSFLRNFIPEISIPEELHDHTGPSASSSQFLEKFPVWLNAVEQLRYLIGKPLVRSFTAPGMSPSRIPMRALQGRAFWRLPLLSDAM